MVKLNQTNVNLWLNNYGLKDMFCFCFFLVGGGGLLRVPAIGIKAMNTEPPPPHYAPLTPSPECIDRESCDTGS